MKNYETVYHQKISLKLSIQFLWVLKLLLTYGFLLTPGCRAFIWLTLHSCEGVAQTVIAVVLDKYIFEDLIYVKGNLAHF